MFEQATGRGSAGGAEEVDVLVVGYGAAGATAALSADAAGAQVLVVEKCPEPGGNSLVSSANTLYPETSDDVERFISYLVEVCEGETPAAVIEAYVRGLVELPDWLAAMGGELDDLDDIVMGSYYIPNVTFPELPSADGLSLVLRQLKQTERCPQPTGGARMWHLLDSQRSARGIPVQCASPVCRAADRRSGAGLRRGRRSRRISPGGRRAGGGGTGFRRVHL